MKRYLFLAIAIVITLSAAAQPKKSRVAENNKANNQKTAQKVDRASIMYPTAVAVPEEVVWRRDVYRELDLRLDENAPLYYPSTPKDGQQNLFYTLFRLLNVGRIPAYNYKTDGTEHFDRANRMHFKDMLDRYEIYYQVDSAKRAINVSDADVPGQEVLSYFVKESSYYDQNTATFHSRIVAICPVLHRANDEFSYESMSLDEEDELGDSPAVQKYPMFWVRFEDIEPFISKQMAMMSNHNQASKMSIADFLATNKYKGKIYMTTNLQNRAIMDYCKTDSAVAKEQKRIEKEVSDFEKHIWTPPVDSAAIARRDSIAAAEQAAKTKKRRSSRRTARQDDEQQDDTVKAEPRSSAKRKESDADDKNGETTEPKRKTRVTARRQRH
ncbi:MAG: gliding motility protein GldN [Bacteroidaceae bacterium]|nr:gliding motility protein GldN [Bacteroidaceae bacterium]